jgi:hypothetical protein
VLYNTKVFIIFYVKLLAAIALITAGAIHTFPVLWLAWDEQMRKTPELHGVIGAIAFTLGLANLGVLMFESRKPLQRAKITDHLQKIKKLRK